MPALPAPVPASIPPVHARQSNTHGSIPTTYGALYSSPHPGVVSGIVLACIGGYLLVIWLIYTVLNIGPPVHGDAVSTYLGGESVVTLSTARRSKSRRPRPVRVRERVEVRRRSGGRPGPEIVEEPSESSVFMGGGRSRGRGGRTESTMSDEDDMSDEIVVEEVGRRRHGSRRASRRRSPSYYEESGGSSLAY